ncbi:ATP-binding protein [Frigidibacter sp. MR17.14]|uniref:ATP-binding protein n=1 Tax=Frigidibacter sp. MR17.14 TaxID=3126509 RepID=UPI003012D1C0
MLQLLMLSVYLADRRETAPDARLLPFPAQLADIVTLFDRATPEERRMIVHGFSDGLIDLQTAAELPPAVESDAGLVARLLGRAEGEVPLPWARELIAGASDVLRDRPLRLAIPAAAADAPLPKLRAALSPGRARIAVGLADGSWLIVQRRQQAPFTVLGIPAGILSALLSAGFAVFAIALVWRETRPLKPLSLAARRFGATLQPRPQPETGAPDLRDLIRAFNAMQHQIAEADRARTDMIAALSHDVRTPLARLSMRLRKADATLQEAAFRDIGEISHLADAAHDYAATDFAKLTERITIDSLCTDLARLHGQTPAVTIVPMADRHVSVFGNRQLLLRALGNLVDNAIKYGGSARVAATSTEGEVAIEVSDRGPGIDVTERRRLLEPFQRGDVARQRSAIGGSEGLGMGLALVQRVASRHHGRFSLNDGREGGLCARLTLPIAGAAPLQTE